MIFSLTPDSAPPKIGKLPTPTPNSTPHPCFLDTLKHKKDENFSTSLIFADFKPDLLITSLKFCIFYVIMSKKC